jgi:hypothetical protein
MDFTNFIKTHGPFEKISEIDVESIFWPDTNDEEILQSFKDLKLVLTEFGISRSKNGFLRFINPVEYLDGYQTWIASGDPENPRMPFLTTAFGAVFCIDYGAVTYFHPAMELESPNNYLEKFLNKSLCREEYLEEAIAQRRYLEARENLRIPEIDECYGFFPPLKLGGEMDIEDIEVVKLKEHLAFLSQL